MSLIRDEGGAVMVEYALVLALLSFAFMGGMFAVQRTAIGVLTTVQNELVNYSLRNGQ